MIRYRATTAAHDPETGELIYSGKTYGVRFEQGIAWFDDLTVDPRIGLPAAEIARRMRTDFGYHIEKFNADGTPYQEPSLEGASSPEPSSEEAMLATPKAAAKRATPTK